MKIREITDKIQWEKFIKDLKSDTFLQSWNWGEFNKKMENKIWRLGLFKKEELIGIALVIRINAKRGKFLFCPHLLLNKKYWNSLFEYLKNLASSESVDFIRICPLAENTPDSLKIFQEYGFRDAPIHMMHPELSWILDISKPEEEILKGMRKTTRNLIRRAERPFDSAQGKENIEILEVKSIEGVEKFYQLHEETVGRHGFVPFSKEYLRKEFEAFGSDTQISVFFAKHGGQVLSSAIIVFSGNSAFYHHGASQYSKIPASYLLMWRIIQEAKKRGCQRFNFWGIAPENKPKHPWSGLTLFKTGFGGYKQEYLHCQDLPITIKYWLNYAVEKVRRIKRGY